MSLPVVASVGTSSTNGTDSQPQAPPHQAQMNQSAGQSRTISPAGSGATSSIESPIPLQSKESSALKDSQMAGSHIVVASHVAGALSPMVRQIARDCDSDSDNIQQRDAVTPNTPIETAVAVVDASTVGKPLSQQSKIDKQAKAK